MNFSIPRLAPVSVVAGVFAFSLAANAQSSPAPADLVIKNATVMTATHGTIEHGTVWVHNGEDCRGGRDRERAGGATVVDATGKYVTPGIIDPALPLGAGRRCKRGH